tara:strand:+ start:2614 stop:3711 length:1098 start_codon:yes stop_codon:yes gene_type:complete
MDSAIDRTLIYFVKNHTLLNDSITDAVNFIYNIVAVSIDENVSIEYIDTRLKYILKYQLQLEKLKKIKVIIQRTPEWYNERQTMISASDFGQALNKGHYGNQKEFLIKKITGKSKEITYKAPLLWGVRYEDVAIEIYSKRNRVKIFDFGLIRHPKIEHFGASPDGISELGIMLEIKCPFKRKIDGKILEQYYYQIQGQLEVCNLNECDFLECEFHSFKEGEEEFINDNDIYKEYGIIISYKNNDDDEYSYKYSTLNNTKNEMIKWKNTEISNFDILVDFKIEYWKVRKYHCQRVYRDINFFNEEMEDINKLWKKIEYYRKEENKNEFIKNISNNKKYKIFDFRTKTASSPLTGFAFKDVENDYTF